MTEEQAGRIVRFIAGENARGHAPSPDGNGAGRAPTASMVEPALLSLFCRELNEARKRLGQDGSTSS